ncbi:MAG TPA: cadherin-like domain-containing protein, partial [Acidimicrobiia bacterium]|nr:cadherin-like domain-containing protein [Acidimicrobiia bacterium]
PGRGYWLVAADGGIFAFGDAGFFGSMGGAKLNKPIVDLASTPSGRGYWMSATDGGIFAFGDAGFFGSTGDIDLALRIHALSATPTGRGYWMVAGDGGIFAFGDAGFHGSAAGATEKRVIDMAPSATGRGYYLTTSNGEVFSYGDARHFGGTQEMKLNNRIVAMTALNANEPPVAVDDLVSIDEDTPITVDLLTNDRDPDGGVLTLRSVGTPMRGSAAVVGGSVLYTPNPDYNGTDFFTYTVADDRGDTATGRVNVTIKSVDDKPKAVDDTASALEDTAVAIPVLANDTGLGDGIATLTASGPSKGTATVNMGDQTVTYTPNADFVGSDSFEYEVTDTDGDSSTGKVSVSVVDVDDIPVANDDTDTVRAGRDVTIDVTANDTSPDGIRYVKFADEAGNPTEAGEIVTASGGTAKRTSGKITYSAKGVTGAGDFFRYVIIDDDGDVSVPATVRVTIGANAPAVVRDGTFNVVQGQTVRGQLADLVEDNPDGDRLTFHLKSGSNLVDLQPDGEFTYGPAGSPGVDEFTFVANDGQSDSNVGKVTVNISAPDPGAQSQSQDTTTTTGTAGGFLMPLGPLAAAAHRLRRRRTQR